MLGLTTHDNAQELSDEEILKRSQKEPWIFAVLLDRYQEAFLRKARSIVHNELDAEEVVQDAFTKIYIHADSFRPQEGAKFSSWAYRILMNTAFTRYQKKIKEGERFTPLDPEFEGLVPDRAAAPVVYERNDAVERVLATSGHCR
jgi:RNA polymerase sigma-70 factor, ECF subfamily